jgi:hypothetical protein
VDPISAVFGVEHKADFGTFTADVDAIKVSVEASAVVGVRDFLIGGTAKVARKDAGFELVDYGALAGYKTKDVAFSVQSDKKFESLVAAFHQVRTRPDWRWTCAHPTEHSPSPSCPLRRR